MNRDLLYTALNQRILPAVTFYAPDEALPVAEAILTGGPCDEVPFAAGWLLRRSTPIRKNFRNVYRRWNPVNDGQLTGALDAGAQFGLAPGFNPLSVKAIEQNFLFIPGRYDAIGN